MIHCPVCVKCQRELRPKKNGVGLLDMFHPSDSKDPQPYQIWDADLWECPKCGIEIVVGFGRNPIAYHGDTTFGQTIEGYRKYQLIECREEMENARQNQNPHSL